MSKTVLDFAYQCVTQEMQKQTINHRKAQYYVSEAKYPQNFPRKT